MCFTFIKVKIIQLIVLCTPAFIHNCAHTCVPCEEHTQCKVNFTYLNSENKETFLIWKLDGIGRAICYTSGDITCHPYPGVDSNLKFSIKSGSGNITTKVSILNTKRAGNALRLEKRWELFAHSQDGSSRIIYTCDFKLYNRVSETFCSHEASHKGLRLKCTVSPVYPKIACAFKFKNGPQRKDDDDDERSTVYNITTLNQNPLMYTTECYVDIPEDVLTPGRLDYKISIWPDVNINDAILKAGFIVKGNVTLEQPRLSLKNCPETIEVGTHLHCICSRDDNSDIKTWIYWNTNTKHFDSTALLRDFKTNTDPVEYTCTARNQLGWREFVKYRPAIKSNETFISLKACSGEKPYNCTTECFGDYEFCLKGLVYLCKSANSDTLHELCTSQTIRGRGETKYDHCKDVCKTYLHKDGNAYVPVIGIILISGVTAVCFVLSFSIHKRCKKKKSYDTDKRQDKGSKQLTVRGESDKLCTLQRINNELYVQLSVVDLRNKTTPPNRLNGYQSEQNVACGRVVNVTLPVSKYGDKNANLKSTISIEMGKHPKVIEFDSLDAKTVIVDLVFLGSDSSKTVFLKADTLTRNKHGDCVLHCITCNQDLAQKLKSKLKEKKKLSRTLP